MTDQEKIEALERRVEALETAIRLLIKQQSEGRGLSLHKRSIFDL